MSASSYNWESVAGANVLGTRFTGCAEVRRHKRRGSKKGFKAEAEQLRVRCLQLRTTGASRSACREDKLLSAPSVLPGSPPQHIFFAQGPTSLLDVCSEIFPKMEILAKKENSVKKNAKNKKHPLPLIPNNII
jgi:hypothetical protein